MRRGEIPLLNEVGYRPSTREVPWAFRGSTRLTTASPD